MSVSFRRYVGCCLAAFAAVITPLQVNQKSFVLGSGMRKARRGVGFLHKATHYSIYLYLSCSATKCVLGCVVVMATSRGRGTYFKFSLYSFAFHSFTLYLSLTTSLPLTLPSLLCLHIYNYSGPSFAFLCLLHTLISLPAPTTLSMCATWLPLLSAFLCRLLSCLSEAGLLVPYRTFMNYERRLASWDGNGSLSVQPLC